MTPCPSGAPSRQDAGNSDIRFPFTGKRAMFPLSVVMVGCRLDNQLQTQLWQELRNLPAVVESEFTGVATMISQLQTALGKVRLFIVPVQSQHDIEEMRQI